jgi:excisionase family DNA binding protein
MDVDKYVLTTKDVAKISGTSCAAVYHLAKKGKLKSIRNEKGKQLYCFRDLKERFKNRYNRLLTRINGELVIDPEKGELNVAQAAAMLGIKVHTVYYLLRSKRLPYKRKRSTYVIEVDDVWSFIKTKKKKLKFPLTVS